MNYSLKVTVLADNYNIARNTIGEHGLSFWIETPDTNVLFDAGQGFVIEPNAEALGIDLATTDAVVISHGHYDHTGGLSNVLTEMHEQVEVYAHPKAFEKKYSQSRYIGIPEPSLIALQKRKLNLSVQPVNIAQNIWTTGEITNRYKEEPVESKFITEAGAHDLIPDDLSLYIETASGLVVLLGCAHAGVIGILDQIRSRTGKKIKALIGGMHLGSAPDERVTWTINELKRFDLSLIAPMHCTGQRAAAAFWTAFPDLCLPCGAGTVFRF